MEKTRACVATIGFFDGVHQGHRFLIEQVCQVARERGLASAVITFPVHPRKVMQMDYRPQLLTNAAEKHDLLLATGIGSCYMMPFTLALSQLSAREFMQMIQREYNVRVLIIGYDHRFGHGRTEGFEDYVRYGGEIGMEVIQARELRSEATKVSSSVIRRLLLSGQVAPAAQLLTYPYFLEGTVVQGHQVGRGIGYPTANIYPGDPDKLIPEDGVYAVKALVGNEIYGGMLCIGHRPTLNNGHNRSIEVHLFDFNRDLYGQSLRLEFIDWLRDNRKFNNLDELTTQLGHDEAEAREILQR